MRGRIVPQKKILQFLGGLNFPARALQSHLRGNFIACEGKFKNKTLLRPPLPLPFANWQFRGAKDGNVGVVVVALVVVGRDE